MSVYPTTAIFLLFWLWQSVRDPDRGALVMIAALPFGMLAAISIGGLSILAAHFLALITLSGYAVRRLGGGLDQIWMPAAGIYLLLFSLYSVFSAIVLVRIFSGDVLVFPMNFDGAGLRLSNAYTSSLKPLTPSESNIAQAGYIVISMMVFLMLADICRRRGGLFLEQGLVWAATMNIALAAIDLAGGDAILALVRTADYSLLNEHSVLGLPRVIGGFSEASSFGKAASVFYGYFFMSYLMGRRQRDGALALGSLAFGILSFSSTGFAAMAAATLLVLLHAGHFLGRGISRGFAHWLVILVAVVTLSFSVLAIFTPLLDSAAAVIDRLFVQKLESQSGLERSAWAEWSVKAFFATNGLGAGVGSMRGNGMAAVLLGSVGLPGVLLFLAFVWNAVGPVRTPPNNSSYRVFVSSRVAVLTFLVAALLSATTPNPKLTFMLVAAMAAATRQRKQRISGLVRTYPVSAGG